MPRPSQRKTILRAAATGFWFALTLIGGCRSMTAPMPPVTSLSFQEGPTNQHFAFIWSDSASSYLDSLRRRYPMTSVIAGATTDYARVQAVSRWVRGRWQHN